MDDSQKQVANEQMIQLIQEIGKETERAAVILAAAYLDELLKDLLKTALTGEPKVIKEIFEGPSAALGSFSSRITFSYCLGLISKLDYADINRIRKIRNDFAHRLMGTSLDVPPNKDIALSLTIDESTIVSSVKEHFIIASVRLMVKLIIFTRQRESLQANHASE